MNPGQARSCAPLVVLNTVGSAILGWQCDKLHRDLCDDSHSANSAHWKCASEVHNLATACM
jgi:hypothetical protein